MTLRQRILLLGFVSVMGMFFALWLQYGHFATQSDAIATVTRNIRAIGALSNATHQLQKERGLTAIGHSQPNGQLLAEQIRATDAALASLAAAGVGVAGVDQSLAQLRATVVMPGAMVDSYNRLLERLIDETSRLAREPEAAVAKTDISAHTHLMAAKEYLGQMRATLGYWTEDERDDGVVRDRLVRLKGLYDEELRKFNLQAAPRLYDVFAAHYSGREVERTLATVTHIAATGKAPAALDVQDWWSMATAAIDRLKTVEDRSLVSIEQKADGELAQLRNAMRSGVIATIAAGLTVLLLVLSATVSLLRALDRALKSIERIAASQDFHCRLPVDAADEIGRISRSFNQLLDIAERLMIEKDYLAATDPLTGISNRLRFAQVLRDEAERKRRNGTPMALVMFDVDHFKSINDTYGHNAGDDVLRALAGLVGREIRSSDFFGRWGGEEFILLLRDDDCDGAIAVAEKLRIMIAGADFPAVGKVACSFGVAAWEQGATEASLIARADKALYASKRNGRNQVTCEHGPWATCRGRTACALKTADRS